jgi:hypothetical protein
MKKGNNFKTELGHMQIKNKFIPNQHGEGTIDSAKEEFTKNTLNGTGQSGIANFNSDDNSEEDI